VPMRRFLARPPSLITVFAHRSIVGVFSSLLFSVVCPAESSAQNQCIDTDGREVRLRLPYDGNLGMYEIVLGSYVGDYFGKPADFGYFKSSISYIHDASSILQKIDQKLGAQLRGDGCPGRILAMSLAQPATLKVDPFGSFAWIEARIRVDAGHCYKRISKGEIKNKRSWKYSSDHWITTAIFIQPSDDFRNVTPYFVTGHMQKVYKNKSYGWLANLLGDLSKGIKNILTVDGRLRGAWGELIEDIVPAIPNDDMARDGENRVSKYTGSVVKQITDIKESNEAIDQIANFWLEVEDATNSHLSEQLEEIYRDPNKIERLKSTLSAQFEHSKLDELYVDRATCFDSKTPTILNMCRNPVKPDKEAQKVFVGDSPFLTSSIKLESKTRFSTNWSASTDGSMLPKNRRIFFSFGCDFLKLLVSSLDDGEKKYVVKGGDTLWSISKDFYGFSGLYHLIESSNSLSDPNLIFVGQELVVPNLASLEDQYVVKGGDNLWRILRGNVDTQALLRNNPHIRHPDKIFPGQIIRGLDL